MHIFLQICVICIHLFCHIENAMGQSSFWPTWKIRRCPVSLKTAETKCEKENENYKGSCYILNVFHAMEVDLTRALNIINEIEIDVKNATAAKAKKYEFETAALKALLRCHFVYRARVDPELEKYYFCIYQTLDRVCKAEKLYLPLKYRT